MLIPKTMAGSSPQRGLAVQMYLSAWRSFQGSKVSVCGRGGTCFRYTYNRSLNKHGCRVNDTVDQTNERASPATKQLKGRCLPCGLIAPIASCRSLEAIRSADLTQPPDRSKSSGSSHRSLDLLEPLPHSLPKAAIHCTPLALPLSNPVIQATSVLRALLRSRLLHESDNRP